MGTGSRLRPLTVRHSCQASKPSSPAPTPLSSSVAPRVPTRCCHPRGVSRRKLDAFLASCRSHLAKRPNKSRTMLISKTIKSVHPVPRPVKQLFLFLTNPRRMQAFFAPIRERGPHVCLSAESKRIHCSYAVRHSLYPPRLPSLRRSPGYPSAPWNFSTASRYRYGPNPA
jgi:hypothetical protein